MADPRRTRAWRRLRDQVVREEPECWLHLAGCTLWSTTADHIVTYKAAPHLAMVRANLRGACFHCNSSRGDKRIDQVTRISTAEALDFFV